MYMFMMVVDGHEAINRRMLCMAMIYCHRHTESTVTRQTQAQYLGAIIAFELSKGNKW